MNNKIIAIALISIFSVIIICGVVFTFQKNRQLDEKKSVSLGELGNNGFRNAQNYNSKNKKQEELIDYSPQAVLIESDKKQESNLTRTLEFFAKAGKGLFGMKRERIFQPINKIAEFRKNARENTTESKIIKVPEDYKTIQLAIDNADFGDTVKVSAGEYKENIVMKEGVSLIGSNVLKEEEMKKDMEENEDERETGEDSEVSEPDPAFSLRLVIANETIINGNNSGNVISFKNGITNKTKLANFTIKNAGENLSGILIEDSSPLVQNNIITNNEYNIYIKGESSPIIQKNSLRFGEKGIQVYNFAEEEKNKKTEKELGSDISELSSVSVLGAPNIIDNLITDNKTGIDLHYSSAIIDHNTISYNNHYKTYLGATFGIYLHSSSAKISNNIITDSGICDLCAGVNADEKSKAVVLNYNNIWNNKSNFVCFGECVLEDNNISEEPMFINPANWNFKLREESGLVGVCEDESDAGVRW
ncbi:MAG: DUF1565 domain-containing protein [Patescibacteria group bacterium]|nr:DUF1565 domain-containing protein [Patescibacteria group bacterium]